MGNKLKSKFSWSTREGGGAASTAPHCLSCLTMRQSAIINDSKCSVVYACLILLPVYWCCISTIPLEVPISVVSQAYRYIWKRVLPIDGDPQEQPVPTTTSTSVATVCSPISFCKAHRCVLVGCAFRLPWLRFRRSAPPRLWSQPPRLRQRRLRWTATFS